MTTVGERRRIARPTPPAIEVIPWSPPASHLSDVVDDPPSPTMEATWRDPDVYLRKAFLAIIGHELRTPISSIVVGAELLQGARLEGATRNEVTALLVEEAHRVNVLIEQLTTLTLLQTTGPKGDLEPVHVLHLARKIGAREARRRPSIRLGLPLLRPGRTIALADESLVAQVLTILIDNAAKYAGPSGEVDIRIDEGADRVEIHVLDRGPGLQCADPARLFELFERSPLHAGDGRGSGIGLYVASRIVAVMNGRIWAADRPGGGADFGFALPVAT